MVCWSGGKDSTASVILTRRLTQQNIISASDVEIIFSEVMYDHKRGISGEQPCHIKFMKEVAKPLFESWGFKVTILHAKDDFLSCFNHVITNPRKHPENKGKCSGFPNAGGRCTIKRDCKEKPIREYLSSYKEEYVEFVGIGIDEPERLEALHKCANKVSLLEMFSYTTNDAKNLCKEYGLYSPGYQLSKRSGCFFCPYSKMAELQAIRKEYPEVFKEFVSLEDRTDIAGNKWNPYGKTLRQVEEWLIWEDKQLTIFDV